MTKLGSALQALGVYNVRELLMRFADKKSDVAITFRPSLYGHCTIWSTRRDVGEDHIAGRALATYIIRGPQRFCVAQAKAWAKQHLGIEWWSPAPFGRGDWVPAEVLGRAQEFVKKAETSTPA